MKMPRCLGFTKTGKNCRSRIKEGFFCNTHEPYNYDKDNLDCFICCKNLDKCFNITVLKCNHFFHKPCLNNWLNIASEKNCPLCRKIIRNN